MSIKPCDQDVFDNGQSVCLVDIPKETAENICRSLSAATGCKVDWHYIGGRVHIKAIAAPVVERQELGYVLAKQTAVEVPGQERKELGYTLFDGIGVFRSREEVHAAIAELGLPIGWVSMTVDQLLPGYMMPDDASPPAPVAVVLPDRKTVDVNDGALDNARKRGYNACIDDTRELNACLDKVKEMNR